MGLHTLLSVLPPNIFTEQSTFPTYANSIIISKKIATIFYRKTGPKSDPKISNFQKWGIDPQIIYVLDRTNFSSILNFLVLIFRSYRWSENFCPFAWSRDFVYHFFLCSIVLLSSLNKEMTFSSTGPPKLFFRSDRAEHGCSVILSHS